MKTAMERMLDYIQDDNSDIEYIKENCIQLLGLEQHQIEKAYNDSFYELDKDIDGAAYYRSTYKNKQILWG